WFVKLPVQFFEVALENSPIGRVRHIPRKEFDSVFDTWDAIVREASTFFGIGETVVFALEVPFLEPFRNITTVELESIGLSRARHDIEGMDLGRPTARKRWGKSRVLRYI